MLTPRIAHLTSKKLIGLKLEMSISNDKTGELWSSFMPRRKEIANNLTSDFISLQVYDVDYFQTFNPTKKFKKWALIEVSNFDEVPANMETFKLVEGKYAVFNYKGSSKDKSIFEYIFATWLPNSEYEIDNRPHFEVLGEKYNNIDDTSEEEIWIPIK